MEEIKKAWGHEVCIVNNEKYCGKILSLNRGFQSSLHHHKIKDETFYISKGKVLVELVLEKGDSVRILPNTQHRFNGLEDSEIIEFSTQHFDEDSYRETKSGRMKNNDDRK